MKIALHKLLRIKSLFTMTTYKIDNFYALGIFAFLKQQHAKYPNKNYNRESLEQFIINKFGISLENVLEGINYLESNGILEFKIE